MKPEKLNAQSFDTTAAEAWEVSAAAFVRIWDNPEDEVYDSL